jgi:hypothetical protein
MTARVLASLTLVLCPMLGMLGCKAGGAAFDPGVPNTDAAMPATSGRYIPLSVGATWTWSGSDSRSGSSGTSSSTVEALDTLTGPKSGISAFRVHDSTLGGSVINWQQDTGTSVVRHKEDFYDTSGSLMSDHIYTPSKLRLDESTAHIAMGATWTETFTDTSTTTATINVQWTVEAVDEMVTVPAGTFSCLRVHSVESGSLGYDSTFWYARNVGKVKETGTETRNLVGYSIP